MARSAALKHLLVAFVLAVLAVHADETDIEGVAIDASGAVHLKKVRPIVRKEASNTNDESEATPEPESNDDASMSEEAADSESDSESEASKPQDKSVDPDVIPPTGKGDIAFNPVKNMKVQEDFAAFYYAADSAKRNEVVTVSRKETLAEQKLLDQEHKNTEKIYSMMGAQDKALQLELKGLQDLEKAQDEASIKKATHEILKARTQVAKLEDALRLYESRAVKSDKSILEIQGRYDRFILKNLPKKDGDGEKKAPESDQTESAK
eukprot:TRINITY_DN109494_c0_g1_i1.p1 TRINITY_DN109494_c0_g1~~TRINITY_DN109494_c0_g1_i1.p1  ORF type:complete len:265 (-),score=71.37 TRINITY_DN109494_c0_g1_i1:248-1042(-)